MDFSSIPRGPASVTFSNSSSSSSESVIFSIDEDFGVVSQLSRDAESSLSRKRRSHRLLQGHKQLPKSSILHKPIPNSPTTSLSRRSVRFAVSEDSDKKKKRRRLTSPEPGLRISFPLARVMDSLESFSMSEEDVDGRLQHPSPSSSVTTSASNGSPPARDRRFDPDVVDAGRLDGLPDTSDRSRSIELHVGHRVDELTERPVRHSARRAAPY